MNETAKKRLAHVAAYGVIMTVSISILIAILNLGPSGNTESLHQGVNWLETVKQEFAKNMSVPITGLIVQIFVILAFSRLCAYVLKAFGQPQVIGEMLAGILLGKSVLAYIWPEAFASLFPESAMPRLYFLSQIGLIFFMFVVGLHLKSSELRNRASAAVLISHVSIIFPFLLGSALALFLYQSYGPKDFSFSSFALFMGIAMSITAFPVLARIIQEKRLTNTPLGVMALTCAAVDDVTAWCVLAAVVGIVKAGTATAAIAVLAAAVVYVILMLKVVKPVIAKMLRPSTLEGKLTHGQLAILFSVLLGSALIAEMIGIHALFGAFLAGTIMPQSASFRESLVDKIEDLTTVVWLPIFFAYTGLRTEIGLLNTWESWLICLAIIVVAVAGKMLGSALAARWSGMDWRESLALGSLMNTRGLMELVVLNIGYDLGILSPTLFAMLVIMALVTTAMTSPLLSLFVPQLVGSRYRASSGMVDTRR
jgi:Kef-type K+ transport system membrane component KefB